MVRLTHILSSLALFGLVLGSSKPDYDAECVEIQGPGFEWDGNEDNPGCKPLAKPKPMVPCFGGDRFTHPKTGESICCKPKGITYQYDAKHDAGECCPKDTVFSYDASVGKGKCCAGDKPFSCGQCKCGGPDPCPVCPVCPVCPSPGPDPNASKTCPAIDGKVKEALHTWFNRYLCGRKMDPAKRGATRLGPAKYDTPLACGEQMSGMFDTRSADYDLSTKMCTVYQLFGDITVDGKNDANTLPDPNVVAIKIGTYGQVGYD